MARLLLRSARACGLACLLALPAGAAVLPPKLGRTPAQYQWSLSELRGLWTHFSRRIARFRRHADSQKSAEALAYRLFAAEVEYTPVYDQARGLTHLVLSDARTLAVAEAEVRSYLGEGRGGRELLAGLGLKAERSEADVLGRGLAIYDLARTRLAGEMCADDPSGGAGGTSCLERASKVLRPQGVFSIPTMDDEESVEMKGTTAPVLCLEYALWQIEARRKKGDRAWRGWTGLPLEPGETRKILAAFLSRHMERLWRKAQSRMGPHQPWIPGGTMADALSRSFPSAKDAGEGGVLFFPKGREPLRVPREMQSMVRDASEPWEFIAAAMERAPGGDLAPLSPYAAEELAEMAAVMAGATLRRAEAAAAARGAGRIGAADLKPAAAIWEGAFDPAPASSAAAAGLWFREVPVKLSGLTLPFPEAPRHSWEAPGEMPGGLSVLDFDRDGLPDLFFCDFEQAQLYRNLGGLRFENVTSTAGFSGVSCDNGASSADYDGDGWPDLLVMHDKTKRDRLFRNREGRFVDVTLEVGLSTGARNTTSAVWLDYDRDGRLDLFLAEAEDYHQQVEDVGELRTGAPDRLYRGLGSRFEEVSARAGLGDVGWGLAAVSFDFDNDGWPDLDVLNDFGINWLYRNQRDGTFRDVSHAAGVDSLGNGMGVSAGDFDHDGNIDLFVTYPGSDRPSVRYLFPEAARAFRLPYPGYFSGGSRYHQRDRLFRNSGDGTFSDVYLARMDDVPTGFGWNGFFFDADNRGWQDIYQVNGWWSNQFAYSDQTMVFWRYDPASGRFRDASEASGLDFAGESRVSAYADLDGDGCLDVVATGFSPVRLFAGNCTRSHHWLAVRLEGASSNRDGIGAKVVVRAGPLTQTAEMGAQGGGFQNSLLREARFGLGESPRADSVEVVWPSGLRQRLEAVAVDRLIVIREEKQP
ncbi:MAG: CRTAC1 family protein [Elusimicrobia bacterium]|nr:CRTAC1 family protein [Elusimicrobiota bacterium]